MSVSLSPAEARKLVLNSQRVLQVERKGRAIDATLSAISHLGYIQIDTISVVARAHHHTWWSRNPRYQPAHLDKLLAQRKIFEYWSHAAAYLPIQDYRFMLPRMAREKKSHGHWHNKNPKLMCQVLKRIREEGPLSTRDFEDTGGKREIWQRKPAKYALEQLFMEGAVMTTARQGFQKVYDLTERVLPENTDVTTPSRDEYSRFLIRRFLNAHGIGKPAEFSHLRDGFKADIADAVQAMLEQGELQLVESCAESWYALPDALDVLQQPLSRASVRILSPFDNFVILRKRIQSLFDFNYQIECYVPAAKRTYGYFSLPVLWQGRLVARMDCKAHRKEGCLEVRHLAVEPTLKKVDEFIAALSASVWQFAMFNECDEVTVAKVSVDTRTSRSLLTGFRSAVKAH